MDTLITLARAGTPHGEIALRRRGEVVELVVNGVFAMDSVETASEIALADAALDALPAASQPSVLVGGLGLVYTAARLLERGVGRLDVVELAEPLLTWAAKAITPQLGRVAADPRVTLHAGDIAEWAFPAAEAPAATEADDDSDGPWDAIVLDVDNGPSFLIHDHNARVYTRALLAGFLGRLTAGGVLLVWCEQPSPGLLATLRELDAAASEIIVPITREGRAFDYALYRATTSP